ncbi:MAG: ThiF family adenylyltransferase [Saprospiraceae bacterium]|nr:ThiF family adenylyltransferase [Saprospiraceae bacterium]
MKRYQQQILLPEIGITGQLKLSNASVLIIGAGGLGVVVGSYLASMGVGTIGICDFDKIEESNLHRQFCYTPAEIGQNKATVLSQN